MCVFKQRVLLPVFLLMTVSCLPACADTGQQVSANAAQREKQAEADRIWWITSHRKAMGEPVLHASGHPAGYEAVRVIVVPSFKGATTVRYEWKGQKGVRRYVKLKPTNFRHVSAIESSSMRTVSRAEVDRVVARLVDAGFAVQPKFNKVTASDGTAVSIEMVRHGHYRRIIRYYPGNRLGGKPAPIDQFWTHLVWPARDR